MAKWVPAPRVRPHVCHSCRRGGAEHGPYFEDDFHYPDDGYGAQLRLYTCVGCFQHELTCEASPFAAMLAAAEERVASAEHERDLADAAATEVREALEAATERIAELEERAFPSAADIADIVAERITGTLPPRARAARR